MNNEHTRGRMYPKGRAKEFIKCWNCNGYVHKKLLDENHYDGFCPLCEASGLLE